MLAGCKLSVFLLLLWLLRLARYLLVLIVAGLLFYLVFVDLRRCFAAVAFFHAVLFRPCASVAYPLLLYASGVSGVKLPKKAVKSHSGARVTVISK